MFRRKKASPSLRCRRGGRPSCAAFIAVCCALWTRTRNSVLSAVHRVALFDAASRHRRVSGVFLAAVRSNFRGPGCGTLEETEARAVRSYEARSLVVLARAVRTEAPPRCAPVPAPGAPPGRRGARAAAPAGAQARRHGALFVCTFSTLSHLILFFHAMPGPRGVPPREQQAAGHASVVRGRGAPRVGPEPTAPQRRPRHEPVNTTQTSTLHGCSTLHVTVQNAEIAREFLTPRHQAALPSLLVVGGRHAAGAALGGRARVAPAAHPVLAGRGARARLRHVAQRAPRVLRQLHVRGVDRHLGRRVRLACQPLEQVRVFCGAREEPK